MNNRYTITFKGKQASINILVEYDPNGLLKSLKFEDDDSLSKEAVYFCLMRIPIQEDGLLQMTGELNTPILVNPIPHDLSFNTFWEAYGYKIGDKTRTLKLWTALTEPDRIKCLRSIRQYNQYLQQKPHMERLYPETYLKQERFRSEFKIR